MELKKYEVEEQAGRVCLKDPDGTHGSLLKLVAVRAEKARELEELRRQIHALDEAGDIDGEVDSLIAKYHSMLQSLELHDVLTNTVGRLQRESLGEHQAYFFQNRSGAVRLTANHDW